MQNDTGVGGSAAALYRDHANRKDLHLLFNDERHHALENDVADDGVLEGGLVSKWRQKERLKTTAVALVSTIP